MMGSLGQGRGNNRFPLAFVLMVAGCDPGLSEDRELDFAFYRCEVQPVLDGRCSTPLCHGDPDRALAVYARNRHRLSGDLTEDSRLTPIELELNYVRVSSFAQGEAPEDTLLASKPLDERAGGRFHRGAELFAGDDVFVSEEDPGYQVFVAWAAGAEAEPSCVYGGTQ